jgi:hypothetical protein
MGDSVARGAGAGGSHDFRGASEASESLLTPFHIAATETSPRAAGAHLDSHHMNTLEATYTAPNRGVGTRENAVPEGLRKLGRLAVWTVSGSQFVDLIWEDSGPEGHQT